MVPVLLLMWGTAAWSQADAAAEGIKALDNKDYAAAVAAFEKAVAADSTDYAAHFHLGLARSLTGDAARAAGSYRTALSLKPGLYEAELNLGLLLIEIKQPAEAIPLLRSAIGKKPKEFRPIYYLGEAHLAAGENAEAEARFQAALELDSSPAARAGLGRAMARQGKLKEAEPHLRGARDNDGLLELASLYEKAKEPGPAIEIYRGFAGEVAVRERLGHLLLEGGRPAEAITHLEAAVAQSPTGANRYALATAYLRDKQTGKATAMMEQAIAADPKNPELVLAYGGLLRDQKELQGAARQFWRATQLMPESKEAWSGLATMLLSLENYVQALAAFDRLEALGDPNPGVYYLRALALDRSKQYKPARENYVRFLALSQDKHPDEEFKARQRIKVIDKELSKR